MKRGDKVKIKDTVFQLLENRRDFNGTIDSVFTRCVVIESTDPYYKKRIGQLCEMNLDWAHKL